MYVSTVQPVAPSVGKAYFDTRIMQVMVRASINNGTAMWVPVSV